VVLAGGLLRLRRVGYRPFSLADVPDYPARLEVDYPQQLNRWLPLVKWLLAVPHYIILGALVGSGYAATSSTYQGNSYYTYSGYSGLSR
jgi:hypothetical protein